MIQLNLVSLQSYLALRSKATNNFTNGQLRGLALGNLAFSNFADS